MSLIRELVGVIPLLVLCLGAWWVAATWTREWRQSLAVGTLAVGVVIGVGTGLLSLVHAVDVAGILTLYVASGGALVVWWRRMASARARPYVLPWRSLLDPWAVVGAAISTALLALAFIAPPNNWDSMTYHMARVAHWTAQGDVSYYATHIERQLFSQPWAEYAILHTYVVSGSDRWANVIQWAAMVVTVVMVSLIARNLGLGRRAQMAASIVVLTLPMGITQATTTQNDYVATMWVAILAMLITDGDRLTVGSRGALLVGTVVGLAMMTKATTYFFIAPLLLWWLVRRVEWKPVAVGRAILVVAVPALVLSGPGFVRNFDTYERPFGPPQVELVNDPIGPQATAENLVRHFAVQFGVPSDAVNQTVTDVARAVSSPAGLDLDRAGSTFPPGERFVVTFGYREDDAEAFAATVLLLLSVPVLFFVRRRRMATRLPSLAPIVICSVVGLVLIESYFQWNPWNGRYLMPFFVLTAVVTAAALDHVPEPVRRVVLAGLAVASLLWVLGSDLRPVVRSDSVLVTSRQDQYFAARPDLRAPYLEATSYVRSLQPTRVGYIGYGDDWEYPLWVLLNKDGGDVVLESVQVPNASRRYEQEMPAVVVCTNPCEPPGPAGNWSLRRFDSVSVWVRA